MLTPPAGQTSKPPISTSKRRGASRARCRPLSAACAGALLTLALLGHTEPADAATRARAVRAAFQRAHPCPSTGLTRGACPGWQADHRTPLCIGGADTPANLQWLSAEEHRRKTRSDVRLCRTTP